MQPLSMIFFLDMPSKGEKKPVFFGLSRRNHPSISQSFPLCPHIYLMMSCLFALQWCLGLQQPSYIPMFASMPSRQNSNPSSRCSMACFSTLSFAWRLVWLAHLLFFWLTCMCASPLWFALFFFYLHGVVDFFFDFFHCRVLTANALN